jgi:hypothetical protein
MKDFLRDISTLLYLILFMVISVFLMVYCESKKDPYEIGMHMDYTITCENGFLYKILDNRRGVILILDENGDPMKCKKN